MTRPLDPEVVRDLLEGIHRLVPGSDKPGKGKGPVGAPPLRVLAVATDGSPSSAPALEWAAELGRRFGAAVHVIAVGARSGAAGAGHVQPEDIFGPGLTDAREICEEAVADLAAAGVLASGHLPRGAPAQEIANLCRALGSDLLVIGTGNQGKLAFPGQGGVAQQVKALAPCSVLIARMGPARRTMACAVDGSPASEAAALLALALASAFGEPLAVLHARAMPEEVRLPKPGKADGSWRHTPAVRFATEVGSSPPVALEAAVARDHVGLLVLGATGIGHTLAPLGSVSDRLSLDAEGSVLIVKARRT